MRRPPRRARRRDRLVGWALTLLLALAALTAAAAALVGFGLVVVAMPLTSLALATVALWAGWRLVRRRRARG